MLGFCIHAAAVSVVVIVIMVMVFIARFGIALAKEMVDSSRRTFIASRSAGELSPSGGSNGMSA